nr:unnamed protein product [Digitaria exilis]
MAATAIVTNDDDIKLTIVVGTLHADEAATAMSSPPSPASKQPAPRHHVGQWLRAAVLGASDGLVSTAALILGDAGGLSSPGQAAAASAVAFAAGGGVPLLAAWLVGGYRARVVVVVATASVALAVFGSLGAVLGRAPGGRAGLRAVVGGLVAMGITYGLMKVFRIHDV